MEENKIEINLYTVYAPADRGTRKDLDLYLSILKRQGYIHSLVDRKIPTKPGEKGNRDVDENVKRSDIILILVSNEILESGYFQGPEYEMIRALTQVDKLDLVFIITSPCGWETAVPHERIIILPEGGRPISDLAWESQETVYNQIFKALKPIITKRKEIKEAETQKRPRKAENGNLIIQAPGGPLLHNAPNYIERSADERLMKLLGATYAPITLITGGIQSGKTSLITRFIYKAKQYQGLKIITIDFNNLPKTGNHRSPGSIFRFLLERVFEDLTGEKPIEKVRMDTFDEATAAEWAIDRLSNLLSTYLNPDEQAVLLIDSIDSLLGTEPSIVNLEKREALVRWLAGLRNRQTAAPLNRLTVIAVFTVLKYFAAYISPLRSQVNNILLPCFNHQEVEELLKKFNDNKEIHSDDAAVVFTLFAGQPYLTHQAVYSYYSGIALTNIRHEAFNLDGIYGDYWSKLKDILKLLSDAIKIKSLDTLFNALLSTDRKRSDSKIITELFEPLQILGIIDSDSQVSCEFIKNAMQKELGKNETI